MSDNKEPRMDSLLLVGGPRNAEREPLVNTVFETSRGRGGLYYLCSARVIPIDCPGDNAGEMLIYFYRYEDLTTRQALQTVFGCCFDRAALGALGKARR